jgi:hypothetical protein
MGNSDSKERGWFLEYIVCGSDGKVAKMLVDNPKLANCEFYNG